MAGNPPLIMSNIKNMGVPIKLDTDRNLVFTLNVLEACVEKFGKMDNILNDTLHNISTLKWLAVQMLNEDAEIWNDEHPDNPKPLLDEKKLGRMIAGLGGITELQKKVQEAMLKGLPKEQVQQVQEMAEELEKKMTAAQSGKKTRELLK